MHFCAKRSSPIGPCFPPCTPTDSPTAFPTIEFWTDLPEEVVNCELYEATEGDARDCVQHECVGAGWFSKVNSVGLTRMVDADAICKGQGYAEGAAHWYGGNW